MKIRYVAKDFSEKTLTVIAQAELIVEEYMAQGFCLTLRQLYYQFVSRDWLENTQRAYKRLGSIVNDARLAGLIDWDAIEDRGRNLHRLSTWGSPQEIVETTAASYRRDLWADQEEYVEVWIEKEALSGVFEGVCDDERVPLFACKGYTSQSEMHAAGAGRIARQSNHGHIATILHFGDHDPSGIDMTRDIVDRLSLFSGLDMQVERLALNIDQVKQYNPPPNPAKTTDSRYASYIRIHGAESWELDALEPAALAALVRKHVAARRDPEIWDESLERESEERAKLIAFAKGI